MGHGTNEATAGYRGLRDWRPQRVPRKVATRSSKGLLPDRAGHIFPIGPVEFPIGPVERPALGLRLPVSTFWRQPGGPQVDLSSTSSWSITTDTGHRALALKAPRPTRRPVPPATEWGEARVQRRDRLDGVVHEHVSNPESSRTPSTCAPRSNTGSESGGNFFGRTRRRTGGFSIT